MSTRHHLPHVGGGWLGRVDAPGLLTLGHAPPELVVLVQDGGLGLLAQLPQGGAGRAGDRGALDNLDIISYRYYLGMVVLRIEVFVTSVCK